jgi:hypothetical protein
LGSSLDDLIRARLEQVRRRIEAAAGRAGRDPASIRLVAVAKSQPAESVRAAYAAGIRLVGENRIEEAEPKQAGLRDLAGLEWHMVGHIQSRKVKRVAAAFGTVHSLDRPKLAQQLDREMRERDARLPALLECNVSGESTKWGWPLADRSGWPQAAGEFAGLTRLSGLAVQGLMTMAPFSPNPEAARPVFRLLRELRDYLEQETGSAWPELSMGMTDDFEVAVEEGATLLRIGRAIFGPRP